MLDACRDTTLIILMVAAAASLALGIKTEVSESELVTAFTLDHSIINSVFLTYAIISGN